MSQKEIRVGGYSTNGTAPPTYQSALLNTSNINMSSTPDPQVKHRVYANLDIVPRDTDLLGDIQCLLLQAVPVRAATSRRPVESPDGGLRRGGLNGPGRFHRMHGTTRR
jgi:hypothetical protein